MTRPLCLALGSLSVLSAVWGVPGSALARRLGGGSVPIRIVLEGTLTTGAEGEGARERISMSHRGVTHRLVGADLNVLGSGPLPAQVLRAVEPYDPNFTLQGPAKVLAPLGDAKAGARVKVRGYFRAPLRTLLVDELTVTPPQ
jgi:hypothetical protein